LIQPLRTSIENLLENFLSRDGKYCISPQFTGIRQLPGLQKQIGFTVVVIIVADVISG